MSHHKHQLGLTFLLLGVCMLRCISICMYSDLHIALELWFACAISLHHVWSRLSSEDLHLQCSSVDY